MRRFATVPLVAVALLLLVTAPATARERLDVRVFARIGAPGQPEPIAIGPDRTVYVGTNQQERGDSRAPSKVFAFSPAGKLLHDYTLATQPLEEDHGIQGLAFDGDGLLYVLDRSAKPRVIVLDPVTGSQRDYATFADVPSCPANAPECSATMGDSGAGPDYPVFASDGTMYVSDIDQALIWRVPPGGGKASVWFTDPALESVFGPNGIQFMADGRTLLFVVTGSPPWAGGSTANGTLYKLPVLADGKPGELTQFWRSRPVDAPDGFAIARSGTVYLALAGASQLVVISPQGEETARIPADPVTNQQQEIPWDAPASAAFLDDRLLVSNQSYPAGNSSHWAIFDVFAGEPGLELFHPLIPGARPAVAPELRLLVSPRSVRAGERRRFSFLVRAVPGGPVLGATIRFAHQTVKTDQHGEATLTATLSARGRRIAAVRMRGFRSRRAVVLVR